MAEGITDGEVISSKDTGIFCFRVSLASPEDPRAAKTYGYRSSRPYVEADVGFELNVRFQSVDSIPHISVSFAFPHDPVLERAAKVSARMVFCDKTGSPVPSVGTGTAVSDGNYKAAYGLLAAWDDMMANCVVQNCFDVLCSVDIDWVPQASSLEFELEEELPDLAHDLAGMFDKQEHTDLSINVGQESFSAHRLVLAARSPVFKAQLYGPMAESKMTSITIQDMEASTFRSMLHYMYHGSVADAGAKDVTSTMAEYQHLLVAADRYRMEGLKKICEHKLCGYAITLDSVVSMLELAEDHVCPKLKARCFDFLAYGDNFKMVATSAEYLQLMQSFPTLLVEVRHRFKILAHEKRWWIG